MFEMGSYCVNPRLTDEDHQLVMWCFEVRSDDLCGKEARHFFPSDPIKQNKIDVLQLMKTHE